MKTRKFLFTAMLMFLSIASLRAQTAEEIVGKSIDAIGGTAAWKKVTSIKFTGSITVQGQEITIVMTAIQNHAVRQDITIGGMSGYNILTPTSGWRFMPFGGQEKPEALTADQVKNGQDQLDIQGELIDYKAKGHTIEYLGKEDVEGTECYKVKLTMKSGIIKTLFFDPSSYYMIREVQKSVSDGKEVEGTTNYSNFQKLPEGIVFPMSIATPGGDVTFKKIEVNPKVDESIFKVG